MAGKGQLRAALWPGLTALAAGTLYLVALLAAERQGLIISLIGLGIAAVALVAWFRLFDGLSRSCLEHEDVLGGCAIFAVFAIAGNIRRPGRGAGRKLQGREQWNRLGG